MGGKYMVCNIMIIRIEARRDRSPKVQEVLSKFGCSIKVRLGLHEAGEVCSDEGILILQLTGEESEMFALESALNNMNGVKAKLVVLD
jgi:hypothetical protein